MIEKLLKNQGFQKKEEINSLVRLLKVSSILPKLDNINILASDNEPELFKIIPGRSITIGTLFLSNSTIALLCLRYGIEWQIWYSAAGKKQELTFLCDLAALKVTAQFYKMLPPVDKVDLGKNHPFVQKLIHQNNDEAIDVFNLDQETQEMLASVHSLEYKEQQIKRSWQNLIERLARPTEIMLMSGGDVRLNIDDKNLLNVYGCRPFPRPEAFTFASSTATSISNYAYNRAEKARVKLIKNSLKNGLKRGAQQFSEKLKVQLSNVFNLGNEGEIIFSPSGTDSALQIGAIAQVITEKSITHIVVASDETGSGVSLAVSGSHFAKNTALGHETVKGERINGFRDVKVLEIPLRDGVGDLKTSEVLDEEVLSAVKRCHSNGDYIVLHVVDQSKLGYQAPSPEAIEEAKNIENKLLQVVIDASQLRIDSEDINNYIQEEYIITITGSKYYTGPPFSGALILPKKVTKTLIASDKKLPEGLTEYFNATDWPKSWKCSSHLSKGANYGSYMRWNAAISEMKRYYTTPLALRNLGIEQFCNFVEESIFQAPFLEQLFVSDFESKNESKENEIRLRNIRSIFPFFVLKEGMPLPQEKMALLYRLLNQDISESFSKASIEAQRVAAQKCHIGQPVKVKYGKNQPSAVVRISLGARIISDSWKERDTSLFFSKIEEQTSQVTSVIKKIEMILEHPTLLREA